MAAKAVAKRKPIDINALISSYFGGGAILSPEQRRKQARTQVEESMAEMTRAFERERAKSREYQQNQVLTSSGLAMALAGMRGADAPGIQQAWQGAAGNMTSFANALGADTSGGQQANLDAATAQAAAVGAPAPSAPSPGNNAAVASYVYGTLPSATAGTRAEAESKQALARGDAATARMWDNVMALQFAGREKEADFLEKYAEIQAARPKLLRETEAALKGEGREDLATLMNILTLQNTMGNTASQIWTRETNAKTAQERARIANRNALTAGRRADIAARNADTARGKALGIDPATGKPLPGYKNVNGRIVKDPAAKDKTAQSVKFEQDFRKNAFAWARDQIVDKKRGRPLRMPPRKEVLVNRMVNLYGRALIAQGVVSEQGVRIWARQILDSMPNDWWNKSKYKAAKPAAGGGGGLLD